jgi:drug/metabolite transporter (DMT)-like permease
MVKNTKKSIALLPKQHKYKFSMSLNTQTKNLISLNIAMLCMSSSGALGRFIDLPLPIVIFSRSVLAGLVLLIFCKWNGFSFDILKKDRWTLFLSGILLCIHWLTYFWALKLSNVAIGMLSLFTYPAITALLEPFFFKKRLQKTHLFLGITVLIGIYFLVPTFNWENKQALAVVVGIFSALCYSLRNLLMKSRINQYNGSVMMFFELLVVASTLLPFLFLLDFSWSWVQTPAILTLAFVTTAFGHTLFVYSFKHFSTSTASILSSVQPIFGILIGILFLLEVPEFSTFIGGLFILASVLVESIRVYQKT